MENGRRSEEARASPCLPALAKRAVRERVCWLQLRYFAGAHVDHELVPELVGCRVPVAKEQKVKRRGR